MGIPLGHLVQSLHGGARRSRGFCSWAVFCVRVGGDDGLNCSFTISVIIARIPSISVVLAANSGLAAFFV